MDACLLTVSSSNLAVQDFRTTLGADDREMESGACAVEEEESEQTLKKTSLTTTGRDRLAHAPLG